MLFSSSLMGLICDLLESSVNIQQQLIQNKGFLVISYLLEKVWNQFEYLFLGFNYIRAKAIFYLWIFHEPIWKRHRFRFQCNLNEPLKFQYTHFHTSAKIFFCVNIKRSIHVDWTRIEYNIKFTVRNKQPLLLVRYMYIGICVERRPFGTRCFPKAWCRQGIHLHWRFGFGFADRLRDCVLIENPRWSACGNSD